MLACMEKAAFHQMFKRNGTTFLHSLSIIAKVSSNKQEGREYEIHSVAPPLGKRRTEK